MSNRPAAIFHLAFTVIDRAAARVFSLKLYSGFGHTFPWPPAPVFFERQPRWRQSGRRRRSLTVGDYSGSPETASRRAESG